MPGPVAVPRARPPRLASVTDKHTYRASQPTPAPAPAPKPQAKSTCCEKPDPAEVNGVIICGNCSRVYNDSQIVSDITFGENAAGAATVQGGFVGDDQRHANSMGGTMRGLAGQGSREQSIAGGRDEINKLCATLMLRTLIQDQAYNMYKYVWSSGFTRGRRVRDVAAVCIYFTARRQPENTLLLMDIAEKIQVNVWDLGATYKSYLKEFMLKDPALQDGSRTVMEIEPLMLKYCRKLEFGEYSHRVADDACKLLKRMSRDWMVQGRQPAGLCGACIILAARMNNFRRTVREVVLVVRVADTTIQQRLYEYKRTPTASLTIEQFREFGNRVKTTTLPPSIYRRVEREEREQERKRKATEELDHEDGSAEEDDQAESSTAAEGSSNASQRKTQRKKRPPPKPTARNEADEPRRDEDGFAIPDIPALEGDCEMDLDSLAAEIDDPGDDAFQLPKKRGRPSKKRTPIVVPAEDLEIEQDLEQEVEHVIKDWEQVFKEFDTNDKHAVLVRADDTARELGQRYRGNANISMDPELGNDEFEDDPDVANCILSPEEVVIKDRIWTLQNEDWLRLQQRKLHEQALEEARGKAPKAKRNPRKRSQMGDGSVLGGQPAASAADAAQMMLNKRAKNFSNHINYEKLKQLFPGSADGSEAASPDASGSASGGSQPATRAPTTTPATTPVAVPVVEEGDEDAEGEEEEEEEEEEYYPENAEEVEEEFIDPGHYEDDEGFDNTAYEDYAEY